MQRLTFVLLAVTLSIVLADEYDLMFQSSPVELANEIPLAVNGSVPPWVNGYLVRNGPGLFELGPHNVTHSFDGFAKLYKWHIEDGNVSFQTRFVRTELYNASMQANDFIPVRRFGRLDPCLTAFGRAQAMMSLKVDNNNINVVASGTDGTFFALSEVTSVIELKLDDLRTVDSQEMQHTLDGLDMITCAHPHPCTPAAGENCDRISYVSKINILDGVPTQSDHIDLVAETGLDGKKDRRILASIPVKKLPYMHSFALTQNFAVFTAIPLHWDLTRLMDAAPIVDAMTWTNQNTELYIADMRTGKVYQDALSAPYFMFHHVNAYEDSTGIVMDFITYESDEVMKSLSIAVMRDPAERDATNHPSSLRRIHIPTPGADSAANVTDQVIPVFTQAAGNFSFDLPVVSPAVQSKKYCFAYGLVTFFDGKHFDSQALVKVNVCTPGTPSTTWNQPLAFPSEPIVAPRPGGVAEDDAVILSAVLMQGSTKLIVLDARTMEEIAVAHAATQPVPHMPFGFHGGWFANPSASKDIKEN